MEKELSSTELKINEVAELKPIAPTRAEQIKNAFAPIAIRLAESNETYESIILESEKGITPKLEAAAKKERLNLVNIRTTTGKIKDKEKDSIKLEDKAIMGVHNLLLLDITEKETKLKAIEDFAENERKAAEEKLKAERLLVIEPYAQYAALGTDFGKLSEDDFQKVLKGAKLQFEEAERIAAQAEKERLESERIIREQMELSQKRQAELRPYYGFLNEDLDLRTMDEETYQSKLAELKKLKADDDDLKLIIQQDNERLKREQEENTRLKNLRSLRSAEMAPYIRFIRDYEDMITSSEEEYQKQLSDVKIALKGQEEYEASEAKKKEEKQIADDKAKADADAKIQAELNKGDAEKVQDLKNDLIALKNKYSFDSENNKVMYHNVGLLIDKIVVYIK